MKHWAKGFALILLTLFVATLFTVQPLNVKADSSKTIVVPDDYSDIQTAVNQANDGDTVYVRSGRYSQNVTVNKQIILMGEASDNTVLSGPKTANLFDPSIGIKIVEKGAKVTGFTVEDYGIGIQIDSNQSEVTSNKVSAIQTGIYLSSSNSIIANNTITNGGIKITGSNNNVSFNTIEGHLTILYLFGSSNDLRNNSLVQIECEKANSNIIRENKFHRLTLMFNCSYNAIYGNSIEGSVFMGQGHDNLFFANNITNPNYGSDSIGVKLGGTSIVAEHNTFFCNNFFNNSQGASCYSELNGTNNWDYNHQGNYWEDYRTSGTHRAWNDYNVSDANNDGINDTPYIINNENIDHYPLSKPYNYDPKQAIITLPTPRQTTLPTPTSSVPEFSWFVFLPLLLGILPFVVVKLFRKQKHASDIC